MFASRLSKACVANNLKKALTIYEEREKAEVKELTDIQMFCIICWAGNPEIAKYMIDHNIYVFTNYEMSVLINGISKYGNESILNLLNHAFIIDDILFEYAFYEACKYNKINICKWIYENKNYACVNNSKDKLIKNVQLLQKLEGTELLDWLINITGP